jgi:hypothetical protein
MSIDDAYLRECLRDERLYEVPILSPSMTVQRRILALPKLMRQIDGSAASGGQRRLVIELRADLDDFIGGEPVTVGGPKHKAAYMKPMARAPRESGFGGHEVWEIRSREPEPGIRLFGRFAQRDVFVATDWERRDTLGALGSLIWRREIRRCKHDWTTVFGTRGPHIGANVHDYISDPVVDLRAP